MIDLTDERFEQLNGRKATVVDLYNWVLENAWVPGSRLEDVAAQAPDRRAITMLVWAREDRAAFMRAYNTIMKQVQVREIRMGEFREKSEIREEELKRMIREIANVA